MSEPKKAKHSRNFQESWLQDREFKDWLYKETDQNKNIKCMKCIVCTETKMKNIFTSGCTDYQRSTLTRHCISDSHRRAIEIKKSKGLLFKSLQKAENVSSDLLCSQLKTVYFMVKNNIALHVYPELIELQKSNGCTMLTGNYVSHDAVKEMVISLSSSLTNKIKSDIENSQFIGIITDESCDIAIFKKLIIYVQTVVQGKVKVSFAANINVQDGKAETIHTAIIQWMASWNIPANKIMGLATDGAAVMTGCRSGVGVRMKTDNFRLVHIHCVAHKLALVVSQAAASVRTIKLYESTVESIYFYFRNSAVRYNRLCEVYALLDDDNLVTLKRPHSVRWLSLHQAVSAIHSSWAALVITLGEEATSNDQARGFLRQVDKFLFMSLTCLLLDILPLFTKLSKVFQRASLDFSAVRIGVQTVRDVLTTYRQNTDALTSYSEFRAEVSTSGTYQDQPVVVSQTDETSFVAAKDSLIDSLLEKLEQRFPVDTIDVLKSLDTLLNPKLYPQDHASVAGYGREDIEFVLNHYQPNDRENLEIIIDRDRCIRDFIPFKHHTRLHNHMVFSEYTEYIINNLNEEYPDFVVLAKLALSVPLNSASCERGFSSQNLAKTKTRNRLNEDTLEHIMKITVNGPHFASYDYTEAAQAFRAMKNRTK